MAFLRPPNRRILQQVFGNNAEMIRQYENLFVNSDDIINEIDRIENSVGLDEDGNYIQPSGTNYIDNTSSVMGAVEKLDEIIPSASVLDNYMLIDDEDDFDILTVGGVDYNSYAENTVYLLRKPIVFTRSFIADGIHSTNSTTEFISSVGLLQDFSDVSPIWYSDANHIGGIVLMKDIGFVGNLNTFFFSSDPLNPTRMFAININNTIISAINMGCFSGTVVYKNSNLTAQLSPLEFQVSGFDFIYINAISVVGGVSTSFGDAYIKVSGGSAGFLNITTMNAIPSNGDYMFDFTGLASPGINLTAVTHINALGSGGVYKPGTPDQTEPLLTVNNPTGINNPPSQTIGSFAFSNNITETILVQNVWTKLAGTTFPLENERCSMTNNNELTFTNLTTKSVQVVLGLNVLRGAGLGAPTFEFRINKNGSPIQVNGVDYITIIDTNSAIPRFAGLNLTDSVINGDIYEIFVRNITNNSNCLVTYGSLVIS